jgi:hypothetical protein
LKAILQDFWAPPLALYAIYPPTGHLSVELRLFIDFLVERFGREVEPEGAHSQQLLLDPQLPIAHMAAMMGFSSQSHFTVVFKRVVGKTPVRWRHSSR